MFPGECFNEFPLSTTREMTETFNGDVVEYTVFIDQEYSTDLNIQQEKELEVYIDQQVDFTLEN